MIPNQLKTVLLLGVLTGILLVLGQVIGGTSGLTVAFLFALLMNVGSYWFSHKLVLTMYRAKKLPEETHPNLYQMMREICETAKIPLPAMYLIPSPNPNAFATGPNKKKAVVAVTQGILNLLSPEELKGVLAHEVAHIKNRDMLLSTIAATIASVITYVAFMARFAAIFGMGRDRDSNNVIELLVLAIIAPITAMLIQLAISRSREYLADETGSKFIGNAESLASALIKLEEHAQMRPMNIGNQQTAHLFIVNPFRKVHFGRLFMTHPPTQLRVKKLRGLHL